ncbi:hypothetical protein EVAR_44465_1 [Eumeta japonica]|uniref:Uncharacterized protein n=1 Tax=Eumeta variegata TaxID=151549 RepID=A0A4C1WKW2_EUMVA|nr:hypothetical protein EVAR_44465_1 [Eumeta japonica]
MDYLDREKSHFSNNTGRIDNFITRVEAVEICQLEPQSDKETFELKQTTANLKLELNDQEFSDNEIEIAGISKEKKNENYLYLTPTVAIIGCRAGGV